MITPATSYRQRFTVRASTAEEAARFSDRRGPGNQSVTVVDHVDGDEIYVVAPGDAVLENTDRCARSLLREQMA